MQLPGKVINAINARGQLYEVGGAVRDRIRYSLVPGRGRLDPARFWAYRPEEVDYLVTGMPMEELVRLLSGFGRSELVGKSFGVVKFKLEIPDAVAKLVDVALPRRERSTGVGHRDFEIEYDPELPVELDLGRRDFTINAMARPIFWHDKLFEVIDPHQGMRDIGDRLIRMVNPRAFYEDPLRMLRACQFAARFEYAIEERTFKAIRTNAHLIATVPGERVRVELDKMLAKADEPSIGMWLMQRSGLLKRLLPELEEGVDTTQPGGYHHYRVFEHAIKTVDHIPKGHPNCLNLRLAALFHDIAKPQCREVAGGAATFYGHEKAGEPLVRDILERLKYPNDVIRTICLLVRRHMFAIPETAKGLRRLISKVGVGNIYDLIELRRADIMAQGRAGDQSDPFLEDFEQFVTEEIHKNPPFSLRDLKVDGADLMREFNIRPGPEVGRILEHLLEYVLEHPDRNQREELYDESARFMSET